jgi:hypothetical protein
LALQSAEIGQERLDLDHEQRSRVRIECHEVDPTRPLAVPDFNLASHEPPGRLEAASDVGNAGGVGCISLSISADQNWSLNAENQRRTDSATHGIRVQHGERADCAVLHT